MALTSANFVMEGPATVTFKDGSGDLVTLTSLENENVKFVANEEIVEKKRVDGSKSYSRGPKEIIVTATFDEIDTGDLDDVEGCTNLTIAFANTSKTITMSAVDFCSAALGDGKTTVEAKLSKAVGSTWASMFSVGATA